MEQIETDLDNFETRINYAWPVTATIAGLYQYFFSEIEKHKEYFKGKRLVVFGAGVRGCTLLLILEEQGFKDIVFCDNNSEKQKGRINQYSIFSFQDACSYKGNQVFLLPIENGGAIRQQVLDAGLCENRDFFYWDYQIYDEYIQEFERSVQDHVLIVGDCCFNHVSLQDKNRMSFGEMLVEKFTSKNCKVLGMHGMGLRGDYNVIKAILSRGEHPRRIVCIINTENLNTKSFLMPRTQHVDLFQKIANVSLTTDEELQEYINVTKERFKKFQTEIFASYKDSNMENNNKLYMKMNHMHKLKKNVEGVQYLKKMILLTTSLRMPITLYALPVNYMQGQRFWGDEFLIAYNKIYEDLWLLLDGYKYDVLDARFILYDYEFSAINEVDEIANYQGRLKLLDLFYQSGIFQ